MPALRIVNPFLVSFAVWVFVQPVPAVRAQTSLKYQQPPKAIVDLVDVLLHMFWEMNNWLSTYVKSPGRHRDDSSALK